MKTNQKGFSVTGILLVILTLGLIGTVGWLVYDRQNYKSDTASEENRIQASEQTSTTYSFQELGISMDILDGWEVKANHVQEEDSIFYNWTVEETGSDGKISLSSGDFTGSFYGCAELGDPLTAATIKDVAPTQNENLMFMSWSYDYDDETNNRTSIVPVSETVFRATNDSSAATIANKDIKAGNYFFCLSEPLAGFSLELNNEDATDPSRKDSISAVASNSSDSSYAPLPDNAESYQAIKSMLLTIK